MKRHPVEVQRTEREERLEAMAPPDRRELIAEGAAALSGVALGVGPAAEMSACDRPSRGPNSGYLPNVVVTAHDGSRGWFYDDLIADRTVLVHCMSTAREEEYPLISNLARAHALLGDRMGREIFFYSLTVDPERDTPQALAELAGRHGVGDGWLFLTAAPADLVLLRSRMWAHGEGHLHGVSGHSRPARDCSLGLARYGNEACGLWGSVPTRADPEWIARRLSWVTPSERRPGPLKRRGPTPTTYRT